MCGNSILEGEEECDDGNTDAGDGCSAACTTETGETEICDDGADNDGGDAIECDDTDCSTFADCVGGEICDDGADNDGDDAINPAATEVCDAADVAQDCHGVADDDDESEETQVIRATYMAAKRDPRSSRCAVSTAVTAARVDGGGSQHAHVGRSGMGGAPLVDGGLEHPRARRAHGVVVGRRLHALQQPWQSLLGRLAVGQRSAERTRRTLCDVAKYLWRDLRELPRLRRPRAPLPSPLTG